MMRQSKERRALRLFIRNLVISLLTLVSIGFLGAEKIAYEWIFLIVILLISFIILYREINKKKNWILLLLIHFLLVILAFILRSFLSEMISTLLGVSLVFCFSSDSSEGGNSLPALESSSSSESLNTFRQIYAADYERTIFERIRSLESAQYYNLPPQTRPGEYETIVRAHFDQALSVDHLRSAMDMEYREILILEKKALLQERLFSNLISEDNLERIMELSPYNNIRKEAYEFVEGEVDTLDLRSEEQRRAMDERLSSFLRTINAHGRTSTIYRKFYSHFINEEFRSLHGLPLP